MPRGVAQYLEVGRMDELGRMDSPLHRLDARALVVTTMVFVVMVMSYARYEVSALMPLFVFPFVLMARGNLPSGYLLRKVALAAPFALFVGLFNPILDRQGAMVIAGHPVAAGWLSFASIMLRFTLTVSAALVLVACTGIHRLCAGLEQLGMPRVLAVQLLFLYRYFFVVGDEGLRMMRSVEMRSPVGRSLGFRVYGLLVGNLLIRAMDRAQRIYRAMVARGFDGGIRVLKRTAWGWKETGFVLGWAAFFVAARYWNLPELIGKIVLLTFLK